MNATKGDSVFPSELFDKGDNVKNQLLGKGDNAYPNDLGEASRHDMPIMLFTSLIIMSDLSRLSVGWR